MVAADPNDARIRRSAAYGYRDLGDALAANSDRTKGRAYLEKALSIFAELAAKDPKNGVVTQQRVLTHLKMSRFFLDGNDASLAVEHARRAIEVGEQSPALQDAGGQSMLAQTHYQLGKALQGGKRSVGKAAGCEREAHASFQKSLDIWNELSGKGKLTAADVKRVEEVQAEIARCQATNAASGE